MIILDLICDRHHHFEGWFGSSEIFREQRAREMVNCPHCDSASVTQLPSAPYVRRPGIESGHAEAPAEAARPASEVGRAVVPAEVNQAFEPLSASARLLYTMLSTIARQAENVGGRFAEEARRMHYEEIPARNIRGTASVEETLDLLDEGILVLPAPIPPESETH